MSIGGSSSHHPQSSVSAILETTTARGIADLVGTIKIQHVSGGVSLIILKSYLAGREAVFRKTAAADGARTVWNTP